MSTLSSCAEARTFTVAPHTLMRGQLRLSAERSGQLEYLCSRGRHQTRDPGRGRHVLGMRGVFQAHREERSRATAAAGKAEALNYLNQLERLNAMNEIPLDKRWLWSLGRHEASSASVHGDITLLFW